MAPGPTEVTAVVVTYNSSKVVKTCLSSLQGVGRVILVDNASNDDTIAVAKASFPDLEVVASQRNIGFGRGCNIGLRKAVSQYILFINPDAALRPGALLQLLQAGAEFPDAAIFGPALQNARGMTLVSHDSSRLNRRNNRQRVPALLPVGPCCVDFLLGAVMLARTRVLQDIAGFDESVFLFYEDDDLCHRVRQAGYSIVYLPQAIATHLWGHSSHNVPAVSVTKAWHRAWSRLYMVHKHLGLNAVCVEATERIAFYALRTLLLVVSLQLSRARVGWAELSGAVAYVCGRGCFPRQS